MSPRLRYEAAGLFMIRVSALPLRAVADALAGEWPAANAAAGESPQGADGAVAVSMPVLTERAASWWRAAEISGPVRAAAPQLAAALDRLNGLSPADQQRAARALFRYISRMSARPTPFGLMAGVGVGHLGGGTSEVVIDGAWLAVSDVDARWSEEVWQRLAAEGRLPDDLELRAHSLLRRRGRYLWLERDGAADRMSPGSAVLPADGVIGTVVRGAADGTTVRQLTATLEREYPQAGLDAITRLISELARLGVLIAPGRGGSGDPAQERLRVLAGMVPPQARRSLAKAASSIGTPAARRQEDATLRARLGEVARLTTPGYDGPLVHTDALVSFASKPALPARVGELAAEAAEALAAIGTCFEYPERLRRYGVAFSARYGTAAEVPVIDVLSPSAGLGLPDGYATGWSSRPAASRMRDQFLSRLLTRSLLDRRPEVQLTGGEYAELAEVSIGTDDRPLLPALDVCLQLLGPHAAIPAGQPAAFVSGVGAAPAGRAFGRFWHVLGDRILDDLRAVARREEALSPGTRYVELRYPAAPAAAGNAVARGTPRDAELAVNLTPRQPDTALRADEVMLGLSASRFYFRSARSGERLLFTQASMIDPSMQAAFPRFLMEVSGAQFRFAPRFDWGGLETAPFLPRVRVGDVILRRAQWRLHAAGIELRRGTEAGELTARVAAWRARWLAPRWVHLMASDGELLLDLDTPVAIAELARHLLRAGPDGVALAEALVDPEHGATVVTDLAGRGYACEVIVPVMRGAAATEPSRAADRPGNPVGVATARLPGHVDVMAPEPVSDDARERGIGSEWLTMHLRADPIVHDQLLTGEISRLFQDLVQGGLASDYHFVRFPDPAWHLRVRVRAASAEALPGLLSHLAVWCRALSGDGRVAGITWEVYRREVERFGGPGCMDAAEALFTQDSRACLAILGADPLPGLGRVCAAALSMDRLAAQFLVGCTDRRRLLAADGSGGAEYRSARADLWRTALAPAPWPRLAPDVAHDWLAAAAALGQRLGPFTPASHLAIRSVLHLHCNRIGLDREQEAAALGVWRRLLDRCANADPPHQWCSLRKGK
jgi:thiopeptide-type bacteriocin biosynthesis protein